MKMKKVFKYQSGHHELLYVSNKNHERHERRNKELFLKTMKDLMKLLNSIVHCRKKIPLEFH
ncbi:CLUMA_CG012246, isoform A [Clunio marinus]|uniref:CLUMA_CG012246, isoform A n=1 Tax=Clunio marinus TaxID=568069 RepID=A0A1J1IGI8_9DIPT|nr:CLUMA_CG012246, isoform A [Clunio marinus]